MEFHKVGRIPFLRIGNTVQQRGTHFRFYANDTAVLMTPEKLTKLQACLKNIKSRLTSNFLLLNLNKSEVVVFGPKLLRNR